VELYVRRDSATNGYAAGRRSVVMSSGVLRLLAAGRSTTKQLQAVFTHAESRERAAPAAKQQGVDDALARVSPVLTGRVQRQPG
jgi:hypothetical protein